MNIVVKILHDKFYKVYYGALNVDEVIRHGKKNTEDIGPLVPELTERGYKNYG